METTKETSQMPLLAAAMGLPAVVPGKESTSEETTEQEAAATTEQGAPVAAAPVVAVPAEGVKVQTDEELLQEFNKRFKTEYKSPDDLKPKAAKSKEDIEAENLAFKNEALQWALGTKRIDKDKYEKAIVDKSKNHRDIALSLFAAGLKEEDPKITDEEVEELFKDAHHEEQEEGSRLYAIGQNKIKVAAENFLNSSYGDQDNYEADYKSFLSNEERFGNYNKQVKTTLDAIGKEHKLTVEYVHATGTKENIDIPYTVDDKDIQAVRKQMQSGDMFFSLTGNEKEVTEKDITNAFNYHLKARIFDKVIADVAKNSADQGAMAALAAYKGIKPDQQASIPGALAAKPAAQKDQISYPMRDKAMKEAGFI